MPARKLTDTWIQAQKGRKGQRIETSDIGTGVRLRVTERLKSFYLVCRPPGSKHTVMLHLGDYPAMSLAEARDTAYEWKKMIKRGIDPREVVQRERAEAEAARKAEIMATENAFEPRVREYLRSRKRRRQIEETTRLVERELIPAWTDRRIDQITRREIKDRILAIADRSPATAHNCLVIVKTFFKWACDTREFIEVNPAAGISANDLIGAKVPRKRVLTDDELRAFWKATGEMNYPYGPFFRFLLLTGVRLNEGAGARWREIDLEKREWTVPQERFKSEVDNKVPLSGSVLELLDELPRFSNDAVFTATGYSAIQGLWAPKQKLDELMGVIEPPWRIHDLRRTLRTGLARLKVPDVIAEMCLGHGRRGLQRVYDQHGYLDEMREALEAWARHVRNLTEPPPPNVVELDQTKRKKRA
jgi:integrase